MFRQVKDGEEVKVFRPSPFYEHTVVPMVKV